MTANEIFIKRSLEVHIFFARIMKEHSFFLQIGFTPRDVNFIATADNFRNEFDKLLGEVISLSNGVIGSEVLKSGEVITKYTLSAEMASSYFTGVKIPTALTKAEENLMTGNETAINQMLKDKVLLINQKAIKLTGSLINFKAAVENRVLSCKMFTVNYPLLINHIIREAKMYLDMIMKIQNGEGMNSYEELKEEMFWNTIMEEHSKFIRGQLDPSEDALINKANEFSKEFEELSKEIKAAEEKKMRLEKVTEESIRATKELINFKSQGTRGILECKIKSVILPLLADHTLREANHYLRLLKTFEEHNR